MFFAINIMLQYVVLIDKARLKCNKKNWNEREKKIKKKFTMFLHNKIEKTNANEIFIE